MTSNSSANAPAASGVADAAAGVAAPAVGVQAVLPVAQPTHAVGLNHPPEDEAAVEGAGAGSAMQHASPAAGPGLEQHAVFVAAAPPQQRCASASAFADTSASGSR